MDPVEAQYEAFPYPPRDPQDERKRLITGSPSRVSELDHYVFAGRRDWTRPFRALVAGGGTGDALVQLAQGLADIGCPAEIHYLDLSAASRAIAEERIRIRGLDGVRFHTASLFQAPDLGPFDYIDCCGVLHHLENPGAGLKALAEALRPDGGMGLMVYGTLGRSGVYETQEALNLLAPPATVSPKERVRTARAVVDALPPTNRLKRNPFLGDHRGDDAALFDLLLHERDRSYRVAEVLSLVRGAGLEVVRFLEPLRYDPALYLPAGALRARANALPLEKQWALAEALAGNLTKHVFYAVPAGRAAEALAVPAPEAIPVLDGVNGGALSKLVAAGKPLKGALEGLKVSIPLPSGAASSLAAIDGRKCLKNLHDFEIWEGFWSHFEPAYAALNGLGLLHLHRGRAGRA